MEEDPKVGEPPLAELTGLQFGLLSNEDTLAMSVFEKSQNIIGPKTLWDSRLGVYFLTGDGNRCGSCGAFTKDSCDGHFGHIVLPMPVYHPFHVTFTHQILSKICIVCYRLTGKKESKVVFPSCEEPVQTVKSATAHKDAELSQKARKHGAELTNTCKAINIQRKVKTGVLARKLQPIKGYNRQAAAELAMKVQAANAVDQSSCGSPKSSRFKAIATGKVIGVKLRKDTLSLKTRILSTALDSRATIKLSETIEDGCKYCGADLKDSDNRYPALQLLITKRREDGFQTITMKARCKEEKVPPDYWNFVHGHPGGSKQTRPLLPFEALKILQHIPQKVVEKLGMHNFVARPEALILMCLPVPPSCAHVKMPDTPSMVTKVLMDNQHRLLQAVVKKVRVLQNSRTGKPGFATTKNEVTELQVLVGQYLTGCKIVKGLPPSRFATSLKAEKEEKLMKGHVLAKRNNISARCVVVGDPSIRIDQISVPFDLVNYLTIPERVTALNIKQLQQYLDNGPHSDPFKTGAVWYGRGAVLLSNSTRTKRAVLKIGNVIHRHLKEGDLIIVNRPPSLQKHSLMALHVRMHTGSAFGINPLICAPFGADFDGDSMHVFVPQSAEAMAEVHELLDVPSQLISSQGGQSNSGLTEDSRLGAHLMTRSFVFFGKAEMQQLTMWSSELLPIPAVLKSPEGRWPLWTGAQLFSMTIPKGVDYRLPHRKHSNCSHKGILVRDGELLVCHGGSRWLDNSPDGIVVVICKSAGPTVAMKHLNDASELSNQWLSGRGFSLGLVDFQLARDVSSRTQMLMSMKEELIRANQEALIVSLISDLQVQKQELRRHPTNTKGLSEDTVCYRSLGLFLGNARTAKQVKALQKVAISRFQGSFGQKISSLARDYRGHDNSLFAMIKAGSKGSFSKMVQQTISLGLQLYKGDELLPFSYKLLPCQSLLKNSKTYAVSDLLQAPQGPTFPDISGHWESRGIVLNSLGDGLSPLQLFLHAMASRYGIAREGVEEPNILLNNLLLFMRNLHVGYDGTVCEPQGQNIVQFEYGGLLEVEGKAGAYKQAHGPDDWQAAGEPVGILAATAITEPAYQLKLDSPHQIGAKEISPLQLLRESLRAKTTMSLVDHQILLRFPCGLRNRHHGEEKAAIKVEQHLKAITLDMLTLVTMIEYQKVGTKNDHIRAEKRRSPWVARIQLSMEELRQHHISVEMILQRLAKKFSDREGQKGIAFFSTNGERLGPCIHFYPDLSEEIQTLCAAVYEDTMSNILEAMKDTMLPIILQTTVKGDEQIQSVKVVWEDRLWNPSALVLSTKEQFKYVNGELVVEVTVKNSASKTRGQAWEVVKEACLPIMETLDWQRSIPYSIQEIHQNLGVEAAKEVLLQRLGLAAAGMGKHLLSEHLKLIADSVTYCGEVMGATFPGFKALCTSTSISTPFTKAAFQDPKNMLLQAARNGSCEGMEGLVTAAVCGKMAPFGTGADFELQWQDQIVPDCPVGHWKGMDIHEYIINIDSLVEHGRQHVPSASMPKLHYEGHNCGLAHQPPSVAKIHHGADGSKNTYLPDRCIDESGISAIIDILIERAVAQVSCCPQPLATNTNLKLSEPSKLHTGSHKHSWSAAARKRLQMLGDRDQVLEDGHTYRKRKTDQEGECVPNTNSEFLGTQIHGGNPVSRAQPGAWLSVCVQGIAVSEDQSSDPLDLRPVSPDGSCSSFHTPTGTLEAHSGNSSPCSTFQELPHPATPSDGKLLENDGVSSNSQSSLVRTQAEVFPTHSCITTVEHKKFVTFSPLFNQEPTSGLICSMKEAQSECAGSGRKTLSAKGDPRFEEAQQRLVDDTNVTSPHRLGRDGSSPFKLGRRKWKKDIHLMQHNIQKSATPSDNVAWCEDRKHSEEWETLLQLSNIARSILHTRYQVGERLEIQDQRFILEKVLRYHPFFTEKIGCGVHYIKVDHHDSHSKSRCFFVVRTDGSVCDFSYHKCIKGKANAKSPSLALRYDHEYCVNHGRDEIFEDVTLNSPDIDPSHIHPTWTPLALHGGRHAEGGPLAKAL